MRRAIPITLCALFCFTAVGQNRRRVKVDPDSAIWMQPIAVEKVVVKGERKDRYSKKNNPAVDLARRLFETRDSLNPFRIHPYVEYERYEKIVMSLDDFRPVDSLKKFAFLNDHTMVNPHTGKLILPVSLREKMVTTRRRSNPHNESHTTLMERNEGIDDRFSQGTVLAFLNDAIPELDIFADNIYLVQRQFISPISVGAVGFYKFYLRPDTIIYNGERCVELEFFPFSKNSLSLRGRLIVTADSSEFPFVHFAQISLPNSADVNFVSNLVIEQKFARGDDGLRVVVSDDANFDCSPIKSLTAINVRRINQFSNYDYTEHSAFAIEDSVRIKSFAADSSRFAPTKQELLVNKLAKRMRRMPFYAIIEEGLLIATDGYFQTGKKSYFDIGPVARFISGNTLEGTRIAFGGITTPNLSKHVFFEGLVGYGFDDHKIKYDLSVEWSFPKRKEHFKEFAVHSLRATYSYDIHRFGQRFDGVSSDNLFSWAKRSSDYNLTYVRLAQLRYMREFESNFSFSLYARHYTEYETSVMSFNPVAGVMPSFSMAEAELRLRYAPGEKIYQTRLRRRSLNKYIATFELSHISGFRGVLGGSYTRNQTQFEGYGRINIQPLGFIDINGRIGAEWNTVPYMLLPHPQTNMSYMMGDDRSFSLMQPLEFMYDKYVYLGITYHMDGLILSRIPLIKHLNFREVFTFRGVYGHLSDRNNPAFNSGVLPFPVGSSPIGYEPYIEVGVGIDNILSFFRIDYVWRVTYLDGLNVQQGAVLLNFQLKF